MNTKTATAERIDFAEPEQQVYEVAPMARPAMGVSLLNEDHMASMHRFAVVMASGRATVPSHLQGNVGDCMAVALQSERWGMSPFVVAQKTHLVNGQLGYEAQLVMSVVNTSTALNGRLHYEWFGPWEKIVGRFKTVESRTKKDDNGNPKKFIVPAWEPKDEEGLGVRVWGTLRGEEQPRELELLMAQARTRNSTLWTEDPKQQIAYLASKRWTRLYTPEVLLGVYTPDEFSAPIDMGPVNEVKRSIDPALVEEAKATADTGKAAFLAWWKALLPSKRRALQDAGNLLDELQTRCNEADAKRTVDNPAEAATPPAAAPAATSTAGAASRTRKAPPAPAPKAAETPAPATAASGSPVANFTLESVEKRLRDATDEDALHIAADLINSVADADDKAALEAIYDERLATFRA